jgi:hypothetical protein
MEHEPQVFEIDRSNSCSTIKGIFRILNVIFVTPNELAVMYQLWSRLSEKDLLKSCMVVKNGLPNTNFLGTCSFMKIGLCGLTNSLSRLYTSPSSSYDSISHALIYVYACCGSNEALFCRGLGPRGLCHKEMMRAGAYPVQVKLPCPLGLLSQWEEKAVAELPYPLEAIEVAIVELLAQDEEMVVVELLVDQEEWQVHDPQMMTSVFDLTVYTASTAISAHL